VKALLQAAIRRMGRVRVRGWHELAAAGPRTVLLVDGCGLVDAVRLLTPRLPPSTVFIGIGSFGGSVGEPAAAVRGWLAALIAGRVVVVVVPPAGATPLDQKGGPARHAFRLVALLVQRSGAAVLPVRLTGTGLAPSPWGAPAPPRRFWPEVTIAMMPPECPSPSRGKPGRTALVTALEDRMAEAVLTTANTHRTLFDTLLDARVAFGAAMPVVDDVQRQPMTYGRLVMAATALGRRLRRDTPGQNTVGVLMPAATATTVLFFALQAAGRVPAMLNTVMGVEGLADAASAAGLRTVVTSRRFVTLAQLEGTVKALGGLLEVVWLEDLAPRVGLADRLCGLTAAMLPWLWRTAWREPGHGPDDTAVVLFSSGSEGAPKGVALSHANLLSNCVQVTAVAGLVPADRMLSPLPVFHSFGLTGGILVPVLGGVPTLLYPSPLHYRKLAELIVSARPTVLFGTDTFLNGYARAAQTGEDFSSLRFVVAGAEPLRDATSALYRERFGVPVMEGYGMTETSPVLAVNTPRHHRPGSVGRMLPGIAWRLEPVAGIADGGRLMVRGPNIMLGHLLAGRPGTLCPPPDGWHDTGDIVSVDTDGYMFIKGRARRFAKIGGEMISLAAVEALAARVWPDATHVALAAPDPRKGERIVLLTTQADASRDGLLALARTMELSELMVPRLMLTVEAIPSLGTGKIDFPAARHLAGTLLAAAAISAGPAARSGTPPPC
jgi:acyl-[acyl-carrier-protein]-phospholipid O-acyltransferase/long-chain-fatty-acid--[acyl-carrier-protein] ligase